MVRRPRARAVALSALLVVGLAAVMPAPVAARAVPVPVPRIVGGDVNHAYAVLHRDGLKVTIARPFTVRDDAVTVVTGVRPAVGHRTRAGATVRLTVRCCRKLMPALPLGAAPGSFVPAMLGSRMADVQHWAQSFERRYSARLAPVTSASAPSLLSNYIVVRQSPPPNAGLLGAEVLELAAVPGVPPPCTLPYDAYVLARDAQAVLYRTSTNSVYASQYDACVLATGQIQRLGVDDQGDGIYDYPDSLVGLRVAGVHSTGPGKYDQTTATHSWVVTWNLLSGTRTTVYDAGSGLVPQVDLTAAGFTAWGVTAPPGTPPACVNASSCPITAILAHDASGLRTLDTVDPGSGNQLAGPTLDGSVVSWTRDGASRSATLG